MVWCECPRRVLVVVLGFLALVFSIGNRVCFSVVMVHVITEPSEREAIGKNDSNQCNASLDMLYLNVTRREVSFMQTAYFVGSMLTQFPGGMMATRFPPKRVCGISLGVTSVLFILLPFAIQYSYPLIFVIRTLQGLVEGVSVPSLNGVIAAWTPRSEKSRIISVVYAGAYISPALALVLSGKVFICHVSWNSIFFLYGGMGLVWFLLWMLLVTDTPADHPGLGERERSLFETEGPAMRVGNTNVFVHVPWRKIFTSLPVWAVFVGAFCRNWIFCLLLTQQTQYFQDVFSFDLAKNTLLSSVPHILMMIVVLTGGAFFDQLGKCGVSTTVVRKLAETLGFGIEASCFMAMAFMTDRLAALILLCVGVASSGLAISGYQVNPLDLAPQFASILTGIARTGTLGAVAASLVVAFVIETSTNAESWKYVLIIAASIHFGGVIFYAIFASGQRQPWANAADLVVTVPDQTEADAERRSLLRDDVSINSARLVQDGGELEWSERFLESMG